LAAFLANPSGQFLGRGIHRPALASDRHPDFCQR
jgi:hypothetical protein